MARRIAIGWLLLLALLLWLLIPAQELEGIVVDAAGPVADARVRWQGDAHHVVSDTHGRFRLPASRPGRNITATKSSYRIAAAPADATPLRLTLVPLPSEDNADYAWVDPHPVAGGANQCGNCHESIYREWAGSAHAASARNPRFLTFYAGTDGTAPPRSTWNVRAEHPLGAGVCATCHVPTLASPTLDYDPRAARGVDASGVHCDYCHKVTDAPTDQLGTRFGRDGLRLLRPADQEQFFLGPLDDAVRAGESFAQAPVYRESRYCASCHEGVIFGVHAYGTYSEWIVSPARQQGRQCQDCHMAPTGTLTNVAPGHGGIARDPGTLASHAFPGGTLAMLRGCLDVQAELTRGKHGLQVEVSVRADRVGHRVPTGFPDRHLVLVVEAFDRQGLPVKPIDGPRLPGGAGNWAGQAGWLYAKQLADENGNAPVPYWLPVALVTDTRLIPQQADLRQFAFGAPAARVRLRLWYRRFWPVVAAERRWTDDDVLLFTRELTK